MAAHVPLSRDELAAFLPNHRAVIYFEALFETVSPIIEEQPLPATIEDVAVDASLAHSKANQAISNNVLNKKTSRSNQVMVWLTM